MATFSLKRYQHNTLDALETFFRRARVVGHITAWGEAMARAGQTTPYDATTLGAVPAVCVRIPTGGGKTTMAAHAVARVGRAFTDTDAPVVLWLVPSDAIRTQTLAALRVPGNACHAGLAEHFGDRVRVCALDELATVGPHEVGNSAVIVVATIQSFAVRDTTLRNVYSFDESLAPHFQGLTPAQTEHLDKVTEADIAKQPYLSSHDIGRVKSSLANWVALNRPILIVDEAHNNRTHLAFETLRRLAPACLVEMTATPVKGSNVVFHVGAQELQNEDMIKLPIVLMEHPTGWKDAVRDAVLTRDRLELAAAKEKDYIRPVLLFQAQAKGGEATVEVLVQHLIDADGEKLPREQIAVATGDQKELDGVLIGSPTCPVRFVVTVEALKEGWDCPFAYVLCSLQNAHSAKDVEQLLGRVLRMPYARSRQQLELNRAYAHIVSESFVRVADELTDRLVKNMGFNAYEAAVAIISPPQAELLFPLGDGSVIDAGADFGKDRAAKPKLPEAIVSLPAMPTATLPVALATTIELRPTTAGATAIVRGELGEEVEAFLLGAFSGKDKTTVRDAIERERTRQDAAKAPASRGVPFAQLPQLCFSFDGEWQPLDRRLCSELGQFDLFAEPVSLAGFHLRESGRTYEIDVDDGQVSYKVAEPEQLGLNAVPAHADENDLVRWLDRECRQIDIGQFVLLKWLLAVVRHLQRDREMSLTALVRTKNPLAEAVRRELAMRRQRAIEHGFQQALPGLAAAPVLTDRLRYHFTFHPDRYPGRPPFYQGGYRFQKHYYGNNRIHDLRQRTDSGQLAEEFVCARAIDEDRHVKHWVRNVERDERFSFWLPTSTDYFYPDFVAELSDGRVLAVEYKGKHLLSSDDTREKQLLGAQWQATSGGRCLFLLAVAPDADKAGRSLEQQIEDKIAGR
ncbi:MAG: DEAD/DEAH box helicase [Leptothrix sp. (in: b-proteobacteria)]